MKTLFGILSFLVCHEDKPLGKLWNYQTRGILKYFITNAETIHMCSIDYFFLSHVALQPNFRARSC